MLPFRCYPTGLDTWFDPIGNLIKHQSDPIRNPIKNTDGSRLLLESQVDSNQGSDLDPYITLT